MEFDPHALPMPDLGLSCIHCGYRLAGLTTHRCPECGREIDLDQYVPPGDFPAVFVNRQDVKLTDEVQEIMRRAQILYMTTDAGSLPAYGFARASRHLDKLAVERGRYFEAIHWLRRFDATGEMPPEPEAKADWKCPACGEENPGSFETCWNCAGA